MKQICQYAYACMCMRCQVTQGWTLGELIITHTLSAASPAVFWALFAAWEPCAPTSEPKDCACSPPTACCRQLTVDVLDVYIHIG